MAPFWLFVGASQLQYTWTFHNPHTSEKMAYMKQVVCRDVYHNILQAMRVSADFRQYFEQRTKTTLRWCQCIVLWKQLKAITTEWANWILNLLKVLSSDSSSLHLNEKILPPPPIKESSDRTHLGWQIPTNTQQSKMGKTNIRGRKYGKMFYK